MIDLPLKATVHSKCSLDSEGSSMKGKAGEHKNKEYLAT